MEMTLNALRDSLDVEHLSSLASGESLQKDEVLDVLQHLDIDASEGTRTCKPDVFSILVVLVIVLPDPSPTVCGELFLVESGDFGSLNDLRVDLNLLLAFLFLGLGDVEYELLLLFL